MRFLYYDETERLRLKAKLNPSQQNCNLLENFSTPKRKIFCIVKQKGNLHGSSLEYLKSRSYVVLHKNAQAVKSLLEQLTKKMSRKKKKKLFTA